MSDQAASSGVANLPLSPYQIHVSYGAGIARGTGADWFGPLNPLTPIAPPEVTGRRFDFPAGYNLNTRPRAYEPIAFHELRAFADAYDLLRLVIETRKDQMERQRWRIRPRHSLSSPARGGGLGRGECRARTDTQARLIAIERFFHKPDGVTRWKTWLRALLEDMFVIDAATLYCQRTRAGQLCALQQLDGSTIKRVIDDWGRTPLPFAADDGTTIYPPAYQQVLKGLPAVNYSARDIIYRPRNVRAHKVYGYSPVQQVLMTVNIALRRQLWQLDYFSEGSIPDALIGVPASWTPEQIKQFQDYWDTEFAGDLARRRRAKFVPGDSARTVHQTKEPQHKDDFDEWLARIVCFAFSVPPQWAVKQMNRATADNQSAQSEEEGLEPTKEWVKDFVDEIIAEEFASPDLELHWLDEDDGDPETVLADRLKLGAVTLNELRGHLGFDPYANPAADRAMVLTPTGYVPIEANAGGEGESPGGAFQNPKPDLQSKKLALRKASPDDPKHPGWPVGTADGKGGQFRPKDGGEPSGDATNHAEGGRPIQYAALDTGTRVDATQSSSSDETHFAPGKDYAGLPNYKRFDLTGNDLIDLTSLKLSIIFEAVIELNPPASGMTPQQYGTFIHLEFADAVRAIQLPGISTLDVETTFPEGQSYASADSIRTDVVLRDSDGNIVAIYDVKTGAAGLTAARGAELRAKTGAPPNTPVIEIRMEGILSKIQPSLAGLSDPRRRHVGTYVGGA